MKLSGADLPQLRASLLIAVLAIAGSAAGVRLALDAARGAQRELAATQHDRSEIDGKVKRVRSEEREVKAKSATFKALQARGMIGDEQRLEWVELLKAVSDRRRLLDVQYEFAPQRPLDSAADAKGYAYYVSTMKIELQLLHEEDLTRLLADLRQQASALLQVKQCSLTRLPRGGAAANNAQLRASCLIDWITLRPPATAEATR